MGIPWSELARTVISNAEKVAKEQKSTYCGTGHLLVALINEPDGQIAFILKEAGISWEQLRDVALKQLER